MSSSPDFAEAGRFLGRRLPEKTNFSQTCNLLSQYLKEKRSFGDLRLGMTCNPQPQGKGKFEMIPPTAMNFLPKMEISGQVSERKDSVSDTTVKRMELFPPRAGFVPSAPMEDAQKSADLRFDLETCEMTANHRPAMEPKAAQMTIFYAGRVIVFNDFPAERAKEIMLLAGKCALPNSGRAPGSPVNESGNVYPRNSTFPSTSGTNPPEDCLQRPPQGDASDLPLARKASLHRFLEKRKGRISSKAPYQVNAGSSPTPAAASEREESKSWLGLFSATD